MPNLDHKGPKNLGPKTGMKLGKCRKTKSDNIENPKNSPSGKGRRKNQILTRFNLKKMKKIAVPITSNNHIEGHFGHCELYEIYTFSNANEVLDVKLLKSEQGCGCKSNVVSLLKNEGVTLMLSDSIGNGAINKLNDAGIGVIRGCSGSSAEMILQFVEGKISDSSISCAQHTKHHGHRYGHNHKHDHVCNH